MFFSGSFDYLIEYLIYIRTTLLKIACGVVSSTAISGINNTNKCDYIATCELCELQLISLILNWNLVEVILALHC